MAEKEQTKQAEPRHSKSWVIAIVALVVVIYLILTVSGLWFFRSLANHQTGFNTTDTMMSGRHVEQFGVGGDQTYIVSQSNSNGLTTTTTNTTYTQTQGVVTAVNNDSIVVAGGGKTQTIKTNSSTTYIDATKPKVNDTVVVIGTKDGDTITATRITVYNY